MVEWIVLEGRMSKGYMDGWMGKLRFRMDGWMAMKKELFVRIVDKLVDKS